MRYPITGAAVALYLAFAALPASAAIVYVDKYSPGPAHDGKSWGTASLTIPPAIAGAIAGDEVWVSIGNYTDPVTLKQGVGVYGGFIGFEFFRDQRTGIQGLTTISPVGAVPAVQASTGITTATVLDGFTFQCAGLSGVRGAIYLNGGSPTISHNTITGMRSQFAMAINCENSQPIIANNVIANNGSATGQGGNSGAIYLSGATPTIVNNTIVGNGEYGIAGGGANFVITNNILALNYGALLLKATSATTPILRNNCIFGNVAPSGFTQMSNPIGLNGNITADPKFAIYAYGNLHIAADSPCRNAGDDTVVAAGETDIDLQPRIQGAHVDIGADESDGRTWTYTPRIVRVSLSGNDANDGSSWALAKKSIQAGIDLAALSGGDVWVQGGTYTPLTSLLLRPYCYLYGGFAGTETRLNQRDWAANPTFLSPSGDVLISCLPAFRASAVDGFVFTGGTIAAISCNGSSPYIRNNLFIRNPGTAVVCSGGNPIINNNGFYNNGMGSKLTGVVACSFGQMVITGNVFSSNNPMLVSVGGAAVYFYTQSGGSVTNNLFEGNSAGTNNQSGAVSCLVTTDGAVLIANNTFVNNHGTALGASKTATVANNIFAFNDTAAFLATSIPPARFRANCAYGNTTDYSELKPSTAYGNIAAYPGFADLLHGDYRLTATSPCVDAGYDNLVAPGDVDLDGMPRMQGRHVDIGCYESSAFGVMAHWGDVARLLRIAGGLTAAAPQDVSLLDKVTADATHTLDVLDAQSLLRQFSIQPK